MLAYLEVEGVRNLEPAQLELHPELNLICGENASGKTSLLEAIALVSSGRSFRCNQLDHIRSHNKECLLVFGKTLAGDRLGYRWADKKREIHLNGETGTRLSQLAQALPMQWFTPDTHTEFAKSRRSRIAILDWVLFHVEQDFYDAWNRYRRLLAQRNAALKAGANTSIWDVDLVKQAEVIANLRNRALEWVAPHIKACSRIVPAVGDISFRVRHGWPAEKSLKTALADDKERDRKEGYTHSGPHRADFEVFLDGRRLRDEASQGQLKSMVLALRLSQIRLFGDQTQRRCLLLLDDLPAELDPTRRKEALDLISEMQVQVFITATESRLIDLDSWPRGHKMLHVKHGRLS